MKKLFRKSTQVTAGAPVLPRPIQLTGNLETLPNNMKTKLKVPLLSRPAPHRRLSILASKEGLLLRPLEGGQTRTAPSKLVRVSYGADTNVQECVDTPIDSKDRVWSDAAVVYGILGLVKVNTASYVLAITTASLAGEYLDPRYSVYSIKSVSIIPLTDFASAQSATRSIAIRFKSAGQSASNEPLGARDASNDSHEEIVKSKVKFSETNHVKVVTPRAERFSNTSPPTSVVSSGASTPVSDSDAIAPLAKVLASRLSFWSRGSRSNIGSTTPEDGDEGLRLERTIRDRLPAEEFGEGTNDEPEEIVQDIMESAASSVPSSENERHRELDEKILKSIVREFTKGGMYFAYDFDITTALQHKQLEINRQRRRDNAQARRTSSGPSEFEDAEKFDVLAEPNDTLPLWRRVTKQFWWNESLSQPFIEAGLHAYVLPVMQGFIQTATFPVPRIPEVSEMGVVALVDYIVISRRSRDRAGLRYQRRGVDDDANVANFVETEAIMRVEREGSINVFSYLQIRGSIPLFWTQTGYGLKPPPLLSPDRTHQQNLDALRRHFAKTIPRYGPHTIVNLAEQHGKEETITHGYRDYVNELSSKDLKYIEYDFHAETKGMKYENISQLVSKMDKAFDLQGFTWFSGDKHMSEQKAVFRVNCIDCLDRTNVVQSAFARNVLNKQLSALALWNPLDKGNSEMEVAFNDVWANNGDAISRAYAGTSALKGDYTRTGKRDLGGMLNDGMNSLARMYSSTFSDWFSQAVIDFMLGYRTLSVFSEFLLKLQSTDPRERIRLYKIRAEAIATSVSRVLSDGERLLSGWTLLSPSELNLTVSNNFEEKVVLLTVEAFYIVSFDYTLEKVARYTRIPLNQITEIKKGAYILSPLEEGSRDSVQNYGLQVFYNRSGESTRLTSYSLRNSACMTELVESPPSSPGVYPKPRIPRRNTSRLSLSSLLSNPSMISGEAMPFAAFKALPIDPARTRRTTGSFEDTADDLSRAKSCQEAVDMIVTSISQACVERGAREEGLVKLGDIVSLSEAQKLTTVMAKMEYGVKRLLWLGS